MKIGILTHHWVFNYGANLQTLSTVSFLKSHGHDPYVINWVQEDAEKNYLSSHQSEMVDMFRTFQKEYYPLTDLCRNAKDIAIVIRKFGIEAVVIGSDTVFMLHSRKFSLRKLKYSEPTSESIFPNPFWGEFLDYGVDVPVIAYSAATLDIKLSIYKNQRDYIGSYLSRFKTITTRDKLTSEMVSYFTRGKMVPEITPDPVFSFNKNFPQSISREDILHKYHLPDKYWLICFSEKNRKKTKDWVERLQVQAKLNGYELVELPRQTGERLFNVRQIEGLINPIDWYNLIRFSNGYIGQLMHPIVIAIHNGVPFYSCDQYGTTYFRRLYVDHTTSKTYQIVKQVGMEGHYSNIARRYSRWPHVAIVVEKLMDTSKNRSIMEMMNNMSDSSMTTLLDIIAGTEITRNC